MFNAQPCLQWFDLAKHIDHDSAARVGDADNELYASWKHANSVVVHVMRLASQLIAERETVICERERLSELDE